MKKIYLLLLILIIIPYKTLAYSDYIIPGGNTIGIKANTEGIMIIGFYKVNNKYNKGDLLLGDYIIKVNDKEVNTTKEMTQIIKESSNKESINLEIKRNNEIINTTLNLIKEDNKYKTGLYVKDSIIGCGTLTYIDPTTGIYGALGHEIVEYNTNDIIEIKDGSLLENNIIGIDKSIPGTAGAKISNINYDNKYGTIEKNTITGIYGTYTNDINTDNLMEVGTPVIGKASIRTVINNQEIEDFEIEITKINENSKTKNLTIKINSKELIDKTGGVVQGMSGSPIIQNNKIVGVLTHVIVDNPITGYGLMISKMLENGEN